jgi:uncharacterized protein (DUF1330 family)
MSIYLISRVNVKDEARYFAGPRLTLVDLIHSHGGEVIAASMHGTMILGGHLEGNRTVICKFPDMGSIAKWVEDAEHVQQVHTDIFELVRLGTVPEADDTAAATEPVAETASA